MIDDALLEVLQRPACAACERAAHAGRQYLRGVLGDGVNDVQVRAAWRRDGALCQAHWRVWRALESPPLPTAILLYDLLGAHLDAPPARPTCPACAVATGEAKRALRALARLRPAALDVALPAGARGFLCLEHLAGLPQGPARERFTARLHELRDELAEAIRKSDYRFADEPKGPEGDAWLRAIRVFGGDV
ncbi:MAG: hypothetical protein P1P87_08360 [Trueperaceae bacterium]|nr:hypothetical protein [Trueperaceae bacterium]